MSCAHLAAQPNFMSHIWEAEWCHLYNLGLKFQNPGQNFLLSLSPTTDSFTPELKTNKEQKQAVAVLIISCSPLFFNVDQFFSMATSYSMQDLQLGMQTLSCGMQDLVP